MTNGRELAIRVVFMGTAELARPPLNALIQDSRFEILGVVTQPDRPAGRKLKPRPSPVKQLAEDFSLPVWQPSKVGAKTFVNELAELQPDVIGVTAYGQLLPASVLNLPKWGCVNVHTSLLPKYRGAAPIQWALLEGEAETGVTIMKMDTGLDTGDILAQGVIPIRDDDTAPSLHDRLASLGADLLIQTLPRYIEGEISPKAQPSEGASVAGKIPKEAGKIDWGLSARRIRNMVRAFIPWPGAYTHRSGERGQQLIKIWQADVVDVADHNPGEVISVGKDGIKIACGERGLNVTQLQIEGGKRLSASDFLAGHKILPGEIWY